MAVKQDRHVLPARALVIGNDEYSAENARSLKRLRFCVSDAERMKKKLVELGWPDEHVTLARNVKSEELPRVVENSIHALASRAQESAAAHKAHQLFFFYYAGHALEDNRALHLLPVDNGKGFNVEESLVRDLNRINLPDHCKVICIMCFDACREELDNVTWRCSSDSELEAPHEGSVRGSDSLRNKLFASGNDFLFLWACDPGRVAGESDADGSGYFTDQLLKQLGKDVDILHLFTCVQEAVAVRTQNRQRARLDSRLTFPLVLTSTAFGKKLDAGTNIGNKDVINIQSEAKAEQTSIAPLRSQPVDLSVFRTVGAAAVNQFLHDRPNVLVGSSEPGTSSRISKSQLQDLFVDLLKGVDGGRDKEFIQDGRQFCANVQPQIHSFDKPVMYKVIVTDKSTGLSVTEKRDSEEEAQSAALSQLLRMGEARKGHANQIAKQNNNAASEEAATVNALSDRAVGRCSEKEPLSNQELRAKRLARFTGGK